MQALPPYVSGGPFIRRELRPDVNSDDPAPPLLPASPDPSLLSQCVERVLGRRLCRALGVSVPPRPKLNPASRFTPCPHVAFAELDGDAVLFNLNTAESCTLNRSGTLVWKHLRQGTRLGAARTALCQKFDVPAGLAWADLCALVRDLYQEGLIQEPASQRTGTVPRKSRGKRRLASAEPGPPELIGLHVVGLEKGRCGFLVAAPESSRDPVMTALERGGYRILSTLMLRQYEDGVAMQVLAHRSPRRRPGRPPPPSPALSGTLPHRIGEEPWPGSVMEKICQPRFLLFPQPVDWPESSLEPLPRSRALEELLPLTFVLRGHDFGTHQFRTLTNLVEQAACYRLHRGEDVAGLPALFDGLINSTTR